MSYILDALKKSEQKRRQGAIPDLLTYHAPAQTKAGARARHTYVLIAILILSVFALPWLYKKYSFTPDSPLTPASPVQKKVTENSVRVGTQKGRPAQAATVRPVRQTRQTAPQESPYMALKSAPGEPEPRREGPSNSKQLIIKEHELPSAIQREIPQLVISVHMYNVNPSARIITIHGNVIHEGEVLAPGLRLQSITPDGIILAYKGYSFYRALFR